MASAKVIPDKPPAGLADWERRHSEPWDKRWFRLFGINPGITESKTLGNGKKVMSTLVLSAAKANGRTKRIGHLVKTTAKVIRKTRHRAQIPDSISDQIIERGTL